MAEKLENDLLDNLGGLLTAYMEANAKMDRLSRILRESREPIKPLIVDSPEGLQYLQTYFDELESYLTFKGENEKLYKELRIQAGLLYDCLKKSIPTNNIWFKVKVKDCGEDNLSFVYYGIGAYLDNWDRGCREITWQRWIEPMPALKNRFYND
jgi:hypothetical protein